MVKALDSGMSGLGTLRCVLRRDRNTPSQFMLQKPELL